MTVTGQGRPEGHRQFSVAVVSLRQVRLGERGAGTWEQRVGAPGAGGGL